MHSLVLAGLSVWAFRSVWKDGMLNPAIFKNQTVSSSENYQKRLAEKHFKEFMSGQNVLKPGWKPRKDLAIAEGEGARKAREAREAASEKRISKQQKAMEEIDRQYFSKK